MKIKFIVNYFTITLRLHYCTTARPHVEERSDEIPRAKLLGNRTTILSIFEA